MQLYDLELSGNCYKVRLFSALLGVQLDLVPVDFLGGEHKGPALTKLNPWGQLPILIDGPLVLRDSHAMLVYLAEKHAATAWWPTDAAARGEITQWLSTSANEVQNGPCAARLVDKFGYKLDKPAALQRSAHILTLLDAHLQHHDWLALGHPTIADIAVFPYVALAGEGGIDLTAYPAIVQWIARIKTIPGYVSMPGTEALAHAD